MTHSIHFLKGASFRMLLIDEVSYVSGIDKEGYRQQGILVYTAQNFKESCDVLDKKKVDVICCHLGLQGGEGKNILRELHQRYRKRSYLWAAMTDKHNPLSPQDPLMEHVQLAFHPPIKRPYLIAKIRGALNQKTRSGNRVQAIGNAKVKKVTVQDYTNSTIRDLSISGMQIDDVASLKEGDSLDLILNLPPLKGRPLSLKGQVVGRRKTPTLALGSSSSPDSLGLGICFMNMNSMQKQRLGKIMDYLTAHSSEQHYYESS